MTKLTRKQRFTDVPEEIRGHSHYVIRALTNGGWEVEIRPLRYEPLRTVTVSTKEELADLRDQLTRRGMPGAFAATDEERAELERIEDERRNKDHWIETPGDPTRDRALRIARKGNTFSVNALPSFKRYL